MGYTTVIYDLDGTLLNTLDDLACAVNYAMKTLGHPVHTSAQVCTMVGMGMKNLIRKALPKDAQGQVEQGLELCKQYYHQHSDDFTRPYDGVEAMIEALHKAGVKQAIVSNKVHAFTQQLNQRFFSRWISMAVGEQEPLIRRKPWPDSVHHVMEMLGSDPARTLYVGDSDVDIETARNAGLACASVCWGFRTREQLAQAGATQLVDTPQALLALVLGEG